MIVPWNDPRSLAQYEDQKALRAAWILLQDLHLRPWIGGGDLQDLERLGAAGENERLVTDSSLLLSTKSRRGGCTTLFRERP